MPFVSSVRGNFGPQAKNKRNGGKGDISGGTITTAGGYKIHTFTTVGASEFNVENYGLPVPNGEYLIE